VDHVVLLILAFGSVVVGAALGVFGVRQVATRTSMMDVPGERSSHALPIPRGGGIVIVLINVALWVLLFFRHPLFSQKHALGLIIAGVMIAAISLLDDFGHVPFPIRLSVHVAAAAVFVFTWTYWDQVSIPAFGVVTLGGVGIVISILWIAGLTNAFNFLDGIDGMAGGQAVAAGLGWGAIGWYTNRPVLTLLGAVLAASSLGFLWHNWHPAKIFMGDVGSTFLGYSFAVLALIGAGQDSRLAIPGVLLVLPPVFDSTFTVLRRLRHRESIFSGHRTFLFHRLVDLGWSHPSASLLYLPVPVLGAVLAITWDRGSHLLHAAVVAVSVASCLAVWGIVHVQESLMDKGIVRHPRHLRPIQSIARQVDFEEELVEA
jgi:UDP-N-acetylmuramyl pentapeptide phosphotransferase/UDP-N-acetylglucosamine-1-phosphate transferase